MRNRSTGLLLLVMAALASAPVMLAQNAGQPKAPAKAPAEVKPAPRLPDGKPDLSGVWNGQGAGAKRFFSSPSEADIRNRVEAPVTVAEQALTPAAREKYKAQLQAGKIRTIERDIHDPSILACAPLGPTRMIQQGRPFEIVNIPGRIFMHYEWDHWPRDVWMDGREHPKDQPSKWMGHSIGKWDGDTLVVDTVGLNDLTWLDSPGHPHSEALHLVERYTRVNYGTLKVQITFDDPEVYTKPLVGNTLTYRLMPGGQIMEWVTCDDRIRLVLEEPDVCKISGGWEFEAYCNRRKTGLPTNTPQESNAPKGGY